MAGESPFKKHCLSFILVVSAISLCLSGGKGTLPKGWCNTVLYVTSAVFQQALAVVY